MVKKWSQVTEHYDTKKYLDHCRDLAVGFVFTASTITSWDPDYELR
jgi:hypothetical protein